MGVTHSSIADRSERSVLLCSLSSVCPCYLFKYAEGFEILQQAIGVMLYALFTYHWRASAIRRGGKQQYDDRIGPVSRTCGYHVSTLF